ncbi:YciI family protein [Pseudonocardia sp. RS11V-5]|uniref:YciI family protein n=1 Tax=Pseudonocardia terrae TaxID=2905831 RepID=UPI001E489CCB|nr:YciI family protein [Pseudonocardia terrae]MCE3555311.1 YciI family protein [Pseudonocardia terrae]
MKYLIIMQIDPAVLESLTEAQGREIEAGHGRFMEEITRTGEMIGTQALADPSRSAVVSVRNGATTVTDGPFVEAKEYMGGFYVVDVETPERAYELAAMIPDAAIEGLAIEVRPVVFTSGFGLTEPEAS